MLKCYFLILLFPYISLAQNKVNFNMGGEFKQTFCDTIPFEYTRGKIILPVIINDKKRRFIFDTGSSLAISSELTNEINSEVIDDRKMTDALGVQSNFEIVKVKRFQLKNTIFEDVPAVRLDVMNKGFLKCFDVEGIIGSNAIRNCIIQININERRIIISNDANRISFLNTNYLPLIFKDNQSSPYVEISLGNEIKFDALFDSGSDDIISIEKHYVDKRIDMGLVKLLNSGFGQTAISVSEGNINQSFQRINIQFIQIGKEKIKDVISIVEGEAIENSLGLGLAKYGVITLDYINKRFSFEPFHSDIKSLPHTIGFNIFPQKDDYIVGLVWSNTNAERAGLKSGFKILKIENLDFSTRSIQNDCRLLFENYTDRDKLTISYENEMKQIRTATFIQE